MMALHLASCGLNQWDSATHGRNGDKGQDHNAQDGRNLSSRVSVHCFFS